MQPKPASLQAKTKPPSRRGFGNLLAAFILPLRAVLRHLKLMRLWGPFGDKQGADMAKSESRPMAGRARKFKTSAACYPGNLCPMAALALVLPGGCEAGPGPGCKAGPEAAKDKSSLRQNSAPEPSAGKAGQLRRECVYKALAGQSRGKRGRGGKGLKQKGEAIDLGKIRQQQAQAAPRAPSAPGGGRK